MVPKLAEVLPLVRVHTRYEALRIAKDWQREAQHETERAEIMTLLYLAYKLQLEVAEREISRLRSLI